MVEYYLPIKIGLRRMHICHLQSDEKDTCFEFIVPVEGTETELFSFSHNTKLISTAGSSKDVAMRGRPFALQMQTINNDPSEVILQIIFDPEKDTTDEAIEKIITIERDAQNNFAARISSRCKIRKFVFEIVYPLDNDDVCSYRFVVHTPKNGKNTEIYKVAVDFGSEASQLGYKKKEIANSHENDIKIINKLKEAFYPEYKSQKRFWQGDEDDAFFKSVFFVSKNPHKGYLHADSPNKHKKDNILHILFPKNKVEEEYANLYLLPNLKLVELANLWEFVSDRIYFSEGVQYPKKYVGSMDMLAPGMIADFVRIILVNFLYTILETCKTNSEADIYLQLTLLVPNVYAQDKVYSIVKNFYADFADIVKEQYPNYKGIEVFVMSESDASFIGAKKFNSTSNGLTIHAEKDAKYLVIDAGKGTTDFSIIQQQGTNIVKYDSRFRTGLPGSGQFISYGFIEALMDFFHTNSIMKREAFKAIISNAEKTAILDFMTHIEDLKKGYTTAGQLSAEEKEASISAAAKSLSGSRTDTARMGAINTFIEVELLKKGKRIPDGEDKVNSRVNTLIGEIEKSIDKSGEKQFYQIVLAGRAFLFGPLKDAIVKRFGNRVTCSKLPFVFHQNNNAKTLCLNGAFQGETVQINLNSELIGSPVILTAEGDIYVEKLNWLERKLARGIDTAANALNEDFFYAGHAIKHDLKDKVIKIGAREYEPSPQMREKSNSRLYYTGNGFMLQWANGAALLGEGTLSNELAEMVKETLFPFSERLSNTDPSNDTGDVPAPEPVTPRPVIKPDLSVKKAPPDDKNADPLK